MKQLKSCFFSLILVLFATGLHAGSKNVENIALNRAVEINIGGIGPGVDQAAISTVRQVVGAAVANGIVDKFMVNNSVIPIEGGLTACAEAAPFTKAFPRFVKQLKTIKPNPNTTAYSVNSVTACADPDPVFCPQDVQICPDGSGVGRIPPSCSFAPCPGE